MSYFFSFCFHFPPRLLFEKANTAWGPFKLIKDAPAIDVAAMIGEKKQVLGQGPFAAGTYYLVYVVSARMINTFS
jgi:hypothetical protein